MSKTDGHGAHKGSQQPTVNVLNSKDPKQRCANAVDVSKNLQKLMLRMRGEYMQSDGGAVDYSKLQKSPLYTEYKEHVANLRHLDLDALTQPQLIAFFINVYNALTIHGLADSKTLPQSVLNIQKFWQTTAYFIGGQVYSLDAIEHGILRGNRPHPAATKPPFDKTDPRLKYVVKKFDPRIHFALVCGAKSCPVVNVYSDANLDTALDAATRSFCEQEVDFDPIDKEIFVSSIFQWYGSDFGANDVEAVRWTLPYINSEKQRGIELLLAMLKSQGMVDIKYKKYDWTLNNVSHPLTVQNVQKR